MSDEIKQIDARIVQTIRRLKNSSKSKTQRLSTGKLKKQENKPSTSSSTSSTRKMNIFKVREGQHPNTASRKIAIEASNKISDEDNNLEELKYDKKNYYEKYKKLATYIVLNDKEVLDLWQQYYDTKEIVYIENWLLKYLFQKNFFIFKLQDYEKGNVNKSKENESDNKMSEMTGIESDINTIIKNEIVKIITDVNLDTKIEQKINDLEIDFDKYIDLLNNFSYK